MNSRGRACPKSAPAADIRRLRVAFKAYSSVKSLGSSCPLHLQAVNHGIKCSRVPGADVDGFREAPHQLKEMKEKQYNRRHLIAEGSALQYIEAEPVNYVRYVEGALLKHPSIAL